MTRAGLIQSSIRPVTPQTRQPEEANQAPVARDAKRTARGKKGKKKDRADNRRGVGVGASLGIGVGGLDGWEEEDDGHRRRRHANVLIGEEEGVLFTENSSDAWDPMAAVAPEFRPQVAAGMASARSLCPGTTMPSRRVGKGKS